MSRFTLHSLAVILGSIEKTKYKRDPPKELLGTDWMEDGPWSDMAVTARTMTASDPGPLQHMLHIASG